MSIPSDKMQSQAGQTLIETLAAIFILITAMLGGLALTIYILSNSEMNQNQIIATNLAREGVEVVRMMRDTNWLSDDATGGAFALRPCTDLPNNDLCYPQVRMTTGAVQSKDLPDGSNYSLVYNQSAGQWNLVGAGPSFILPMDLVTGMYSVQGSTNGTINSNFSRKVELISNTASPYTANAGTNNSNAELIVRVTVGWQDKKCTVWDFKADPSTTNCKVVVEEHLTNWKDYK